MRNITISLPEGLARWARVWAARNDTSVSGMLRDLLAKKMEAEEGYTQAMETYLARKPKPLSSGGSLPKRGELHDRADLR